VCCVLFERGVLYCVMCVIYVLYLILVQLPTGKNPFAVKINNSELKIFFRTVHCGLCLLLVESRTAIRHRSQQGNSIFCKST
jgi:hypothetical protein